MCKGLNPCFVGMWSFRFDPDNVKDWQMAVLILVLLGCGLLAKISTKGKTKEVLILVLLGCGLLELVMNY